MTGFMLVATILFVLTHALRPHNGHLASGHLHLAAPRRIDATPTTDNADSAVSPCTGSACVIFHPPQAINLPCTDVNGTIISAGANNQEWRMLCDIDFFAQDIYPFILAGSFEKCLKYCDSYNRGNSADQCVGFVFAPDRIDLENDCYLKSATNNAISPSTIHLIGATLLPQPAQSASAAVTGDSLPIDKAPDDVEQSPTPILMEAKLLGFSTNNPTKHYVSHSPVLPIKLASTLLKPGINIDLVTKYPLAPDTGSWTGSTVPVDFVLSNITYPPSLSRDGGKGGNINGTHVFYFCDTSTFGNINGPLGYMNGFVSSSAAVDQSKKALSGDALELQAPIGQWQDDVGRLRGWIPMTTGEEAFNIAVSGEGYRYAVWPESSFIPLNSSRSILYASVVYVEVDMQTQHAQFTSLGNTLAVISVDETYGPHADRVVKQMFTEQEVQWGSLGGLRAWGKSGQGHDDGMIYLFGQVENGVLVAKTTPSDVGDRSTYAYWNGTSWSQTMPGTDSTAYMVEQAVMDFDIVYSPSHQTFVMFYLTPLADNTFYMRWLQKTNILPPYMSGGTEDYAENILHHNWSEPVVLYKADTPAEGYIYAGGCHFGYFGSDDFAHGGDQLLITWTEHTEKDPNNPASGYAHKSAVLTLQ